MCLKVGISGLYKEIYGQLALPRADESAWDIALRTNKVEPNICHLVFRSVEQRAEVATMLKGIKVERVMLTGALEEKYFSLRVNAEQSVVIEALKGLGFQIL